MKLGELRPAEGSNAQGLGEGAEVTLLETAKQPAEATRDRAPVRVQAERAGFEGGQMPLYRRLPKRGFHLQKQ